MTARGDANVKLHQSNLRRTSAARAENLTVITNNSPERNKISVTSYCYATLTVLTNAHESIFADTLLRGTRFWVFRYIE